MKAFWGGKTTWIVGSCVLVALALFSLPACYQPPEKAATPVAQKTTPAEEPAQALPTAEPFVPPAKTVAPKLPKPKPPRPTANEKPVAKPESAPKKTETITPPATPAAPPSPPTQDLPAETPPEDALSLAKINQVQEGMSYTQVRAILGDPGTPLSSGQVKTKIYRWSGESGTRMLARFEEDRLVRKNLSIPEEVAAAQKGQEVQLSKEEYNKVATGMSPVEVESLLGISPQVVSDSSVGMAILRWSDEKGSNFTARFENGRLTRKTGFVVAALPKESAAAQETMVEDAGAAEGELLTEGEAPEEGPRRRDMGMRAARDQAPLSEGELPAQEQETMPMEAAPVQAPSRVHVSGGERRQRILEEDTRPVAGRSYKPKAKLPKFTYKCRRGSYEIRVENTGTATVQVGLRTGKYGRNLKISSGRHASVFVNQGAYQLYYIYADAPYTLHQGQTIRIDGNFLSDALVTLFNEADNVGILDYGLIRN